STPHPGGGFYRKWPAVFLRFQWVATPTATARAQIPIPSPTCHLEKSRMDIRDQAGSQGSHRFGAGIQRSPRHFGSHLHLRKTTEFFHRGKYRECRIGRASKDRSLWNRPRAGRKAIV